MCGEEGRVQAMPEFKLYFSNSNKSLNQFLFYKMGLILPTFQDFCREYRNIREISSSLPHPQITTHGQLSGNYVGMTGVMF